MKTPEEYEKEIEQLKAQLAQMKSGALLTMAGAQTYSPTRQSLSIVGLEEMILLVDQKDKVGFVESKMARLLGASNRKDMLGTTLEQWDKGPLGDGFISTLVESARRSGQAYVIERSFEDFPEDRMDKPAGSKQGKAMLMRFAAVPTQDRVEIIVQDISQLRWLESTFSRYVSPRVIDMLRDIPDSELMRSEKRTVSILFADMRGFTSACQEMDAEEVRNMVNEYLTNMVECVERYDGTVDKFVGDEIMAIFGAPLATSDHALRAMMTASRMVSVHAEWVAKRTEQGKIAPLVGVGIATGEAIVGNIGTETRMDYTVLGHTVNLAARLCGKAAGGQILIVKSTYEGASGAVNDWKGQDPVPRFNFERIKEKIELKNVKTPVDVYAVKF